MPRTLLPLNLILISALAISLAACAGNPPATDSVLSHPSDSPTAQARSYIKNIEKSTSYPSFTYALLDGEGEIFEESYGQGAASSFYAYSTAKIITALAVLTLADKGKLSLDDALSQHLDFISWPITLRQVLSHSAGIPDPVIGNMYVHFPEEHSQYDRENEIRKTAAKSKLKFAPGTSVAYSNLGYALLGMVIEKAWGGSYEEAIDSLVFKPLAMDPSDAGFDPLRAGSLAGARIGKDPLQRWMLALAMPRNAFRSEGPWIALRDQFYFNFPSHGGLIITRKAFSCLLSAIIRQDSRLLSPSSWESFFTSQASGRGKTFAIGWSMEQEAGVRRFIHTGGGLGISASIAIYPERGLASVCLTDRLGNMRLGNKDGPALDRILLRQKEGLFPASEKNPDCSK